jgi:antitoxin FitA
MDVCGLAVQAPDDIIDSMAQLIVRNIEDAVVEALKREAARNGRSAEAEHREILRRHLMKGPRRSLKAHLLAIPDVGEDGDFDVGRPPARRVDL